MKVLTRKEADRHALETAEEVTEGNLMGLKNLGLFSWKPEPWSSIADPNHVYFFWAYEYGQDYQDLDYAPSEYPEPGYLLVGTGPKGGAPVGGEGEVEVEAFTRKDTMMDGLRKATTTTLKRAGLTDLEILAVLGAA
jgi:hypothetical protein